MDRSSNIQFKCSICSSPRTATDLIQLEGWKAQMFTEFVGIELPTNGVEGESCICQQCFDKLEISYNFKAEGRRAAERERLEIQRRLAAARQKKRQETTRNDPYATPTSDQSDDNIVKLSGKGKFRCLKCGFGYQTKQGLQLHSSFKKAHRCIDCDVKFSCKLLLSRHRREFHGNNAFNCSKCPYQTKVEHNLMKHKATHDKPFACETCLKKFSKNELLKNHQMQHQHGTYATAPEEVFDCLKCDKSFSSQMYLETHQMRFHKETEAEAEGEVRDKNYKNRVAMRQYSERHAKIECSICKKMIVKRFMTAHLRSHSALFRDPRRRGDPARFECDICGKGFERKCDLGLHMRSHSKETFPCNKCGYGFTTKWKLQHHERSKMTYKCAVCDVKFSCQLLLVRHRSEFHGDAAAPEATFDCDKCFKSFSSPWNLLQHQGQVHDKKETKCEVCGKTYKNQSSLHAHQRRVHKMRFPWN